VKKIPENKATTTPLFNCTYVSKTNDLNYCPNSKMGKRIFKYCDPEILI